MKYAGGIREFESGSSTPEVSRSPLQAPTLARPELKAKSCSELAEIIEQSLPPSSSSMTPEFIRGYKMTGEKFLSLSSERIKDLAEADPQVLSLLRRLQGKKPRSLYGHKERPRVHDIFTRIMSSPAPSSSWSTYSADEDDIQPFNLDNDTPTAGSPKPGAARTEFPEHCSERSTAHLDEAMETSDAPSEDEVPDSTVERDVVATPVEIYSAPEDILAATSQAQQSPLAAVEDDDEPPMPGSFTSSPVGSRFPDYSSLLGAAGLLISGSINDTIQEDGADSNGESEPVSAISQDHQEVEDAESSTDSEMHGSDDTKALQSQSGDGSESVMTPSERSLSTIGEDIDRLVDACNFKDSEGHSVELSMQSEEDGESDHETVHPETPLLPHSVPLPCSRPETPNFESEAVETLNDHSSAHALESADGGEVVAQKPSENESESCEEGTGNNDGNEDSSNNLGNNSNNDHLATDDEQRDPATKDPNTCENSTQEASTPLPGVESSTLSDPALSDEHHAAKNSLDGEDSSHVPTEELSGSGEATETTETVSPTSSNKDKVWWAGGGLPETPSDRIDEERVESEASKMTTEDSLSGERNGEPVAVATPAAKKPHSSGQSDEETFALDRNPAKNSGVIKRDQKSKQKARKHGITFYNLSSKAMEAMMAGKDAALETVPLSAIAEEAEDNLANLEALMISEDVAENGSLTVDQRAVETAEVEASPEESSGMATPKVSECRKNPDNPPQPDIILSSTGTESTADDGNSIPTGAEREDNLPSDSEGEPKDKPNEFARDGEQSMTGESATRDESVPIDGDGVPRNNGSMVGSEQRDALDEDQPAGTEDKLQTGSVPTTIDDDSPNIEDVAQSQADPDKSNAMAEEVEHKEAGTGPSVAVEDSTNVEGGAGSSPDDDKDEQSLKQAQSSSGPDALTDEVKDNTEESQPSGEIRASSDESEVVENPAEGSSGRETDPEASSENAVQELPVPSFGDFLSGYITNAYAGYSFAQSSQDPIASTDSEANQEPLHDPAESESESSTAVDDGETPRPSDEHCDEIEEDDSRVSPTIPATSVSQSFFDYANNIYSQYRFGKSTISVGQLFDGYAKNVYDQPFNRLVPRENNPTILEEQPARERAELLISSPHADPALTVETGLLLSEEHASTPASWDTPPTSVADTPLHTGDVSVPPPEQHVRFDSRARSKSRHRRASSEFDGSASRDEVLERLLRHVQGLEERIFGLERENQLLWQRVNRMSPSQSTASPSTVSPASPFFSRFSLLRA